MSWADYGFHGLDATFALINVTWMACVKAIKERYEIVGLTDTNLTRIADSGYYKIRFPLWYNSIDTRSDGRRHFDMANYIYYVVNSYVHSISYPKVYDMTTLGTAGCNLVAATGRTCVYDGREFNEGISDSNKTDYYEELLFKLLDQSWILKYKAMLDLLRYPIISSNYANPTCVSKMYRYNGSPFTSLNDAITAITSSSEEISYSWSNYASASQNLFYVTKILNGDAYEYKIQLLLKKAYVEASDVDDVIQSTGDSTSDYYVRYRINLRNTLANPTAIYFEYEFMARVDRSHLVYVDYIGEDCYELELEFDTQELIDLITEKLGEDRDFTLICGGGVSGAISRIYDGVNYFQFLDPISPTPAAAG